MNPSRPVYQAFLESQSFGGSSRRRPTPIRRPTRKHPFLWAFITTLNLFVAVGVWTGIATLNAKPENPRCYALLERLGKLQPLHTFGSPDHPAPESELFDGAALQRRFGSFSESQLEALNTQLLRGYITNYEESSAVPMVEGEFALLGSRPLESTDLFQSGLVLLARSTAEDGSKVLLEYVLPTGATAAPNPADLGLTGTEVTLPPLRLTGEGQRATVTHIEKLPNDELLFSVVPLNYASPAFAGGQTLALTPPAKLNIEAGLPIIKASDIFPANGTTDAAVAARD